MPTLKNLPMKTIGLTLQINVPNFSIWSNGARQHVFYLADTLQRAGYRVYITLVKGKENYPVTANMGWDINKYKVVPIEDVKDDLDMLILIGSEIAISMGQYLKHRGCKIIYNLVGARYIMDMEEMIFKGGKPVRHDESYVDELWMLPHMVNTCHHYMETVYGFKVKHVPYIWGTEFLDQSRAALPNKGMYIMRPLPKSASSFEPNINVVKFCMYDLMIAEKVYRRRPDLLKMMYVTNTKNLRTQPMFISLMKKLQIVKDKAASFDSRYPVSYILSKFTDVVVSHQWENGLNNAYLDALYLEFPLVHNAPFIKDGGYYYEGFDADAGAEQLIFALEHHDKHLDEYRKKNAPVLQRYLNTTPHMIEAYKTLVEEALTATAQA